jgi:hypothetical protein
MPFEVKPIKGTDPAYRGRAEVAADIASYYNAITKRGGQIVAGHTIEDPSYAPACPTKSIGHAIGHATLYLVAELPEPPLGPFDS